MTIFNSILHVVSEKKIFEISANQRLLWPLAAILDNRSEQKVTTIDQEHFCQVWFQSIHWFLRRSLFNIFPLGLPGGQFQDFQLGGGTLKKVAPRGGKRNFFGGISCGKSKFYAKRIIFFPILGRGGCAPLDPPLVAMLKYVPH
jgi:hypothetical protein